MREGRRGEDVVGSEERREEGVHTSDLRVKETPSNVSGAR